MVKFTSKIVVLLVILTFIFFGLNHVFKEFNHFEKSMQEYKSEKGNIELAVFGSSHAFNTYDIRRIETGLSLSSFNFGGAAQRLETTEVVLNEIINENNLKLIIVDIFPMSIDGVDSEGGKHLQLQTLDHLPLSFSKITQANKIFGKEYLPYALFPFLRNHSEWNTINGLRFSRHFRLISKNDFYKGYRGVSETFNDKIWDEFYNKFNSKANTNFIDLSEEQKSKIDKIINIAEKKKVPLIFVNAPSFVTDYDENYSKTTDYIKKYIKSKNIAFLDFDWMRKEGVINKKDFLDPNHLNPPGAIAVTDSLVNFIDKNYTFKGSKLGKTFEHNKLYHINNNFKKAEFHLNIKKEGIKSFALTQSASNTIEFIIENNIKEPVSIKLDIGLTKFQRLTKFYKDAMYVKDNRYFNWAELNDFNSFNLNGKRYNSVQFYYPFDYIENIKVFIGENSKNPILNENQIELQSQYGN